MHNQKKTVQGDQLTEGGCKIEMTTPNCGVEQI
jgi:hypothetical protein